LIAHEIKRGEHNVLPLLQLLHGEGIECFIAGGFARWMLSPLEAPAYPSDIDIYFGNGTHRSDDVADILMKNGFNLVKNSRHAISLNPPEKGVFSDCIPIQIIKAIANRFGDPDLVITGFDFTVVKAAVFLDKVGQQLLGITSHAFLTDEQNKQIVIDGIPNTFATLQRCFKYVEKGYKLAPRELLKILAHWDSLSVDKKVKLGNYVSGLVPATSTEFYDLLDTM